MTATDELRRMLDERGVEYEGETDEDGWAFTRWHGFDDTGWLALSDELCGLLDLRGRYLFTPAQAIDATLGRGTCRVESMHGYTDPYTTTRYVVELNCHTLDDWPESEPPAYCPWCGAKVVDA